MSKNILISGAGIAGPTLAFWLARGGMKVTVIERAPLLRTAGQTVDIRGAGLEVMRRMELEETIRSKTTQEQGIYFVDTNNRVQAEFPVSSFGGQGLVSEIEIVRGELATILYESTSNDVEYIFGNSISKIDEKDNSVHVDFADGSTREFDLVVVAEGVRSRTRDLVFKNDSCILPLNMNVSYFSIPYAESDGTWSRSFNAIRGRSITLRPDGDGATTRAFLSVSSPPNSLDKLDIEGQKAETHKVFADAGWEAPRILRGMEECRDFYLQEVSQVKMDKWSKGRVVLLGDAAYCPSGISGMGTSVSIVGAYILAGEIVSKPNHEDAFASYETILRPYVNKAQKLIPGTPQLALPQTAWGIWTFHSVMSAASFASRIGASSLVSMLSPPADSIQLPKYEL